MAAKKKSTSAKPTSRRFGYIDLAGVYVIEPVYELVRRFAQGFGFVRKNQRWFAVDREGPPAFEHTFDDARYFSDGLARVNRGARQTMGEVDGGGFAFIDPAATS